MRRRVLWLVSLAALVIATWWFLPHERALLPLATRRAFISDQDKVLDWITDHEALILRDASGIANQSRRIELLRLNSVHGDSTSLLIAPNEIDAPFGYQVSPDRQWLLLYNLFQDDDTVIGGNSVTWMASEKKAIAISLNSSRRVSFIQTQSEVWMVWLPDSHRMLEIYDVYAGSRFVLTLDSLDAPRKHTLLPAIVQKPGRSPITISGTSPLGVTPDNHLLLTGWKRTNWSEWGNTPTDRVSIYDIDLRTRPMVTQEILVTMPPNAEVEEMALSPDGKRIAWKLFFCDRPPQTNLFLRLLDYFRPRKAVSNSQTNPMGTGALWVSRSDGSALHEIGHIAKTQNWQSPNNLCWLPDGKHLSFVHNHALYTVPAD